MRTTKMKIYSILLSFVFLALPALGQSQENSCPTGSCEAVSATGFNSDCYNCDNGSPFKLCQFGACGCGCDCGHNCHCGCATSGHCDCDQDGMIDIAPPAHAINPQRCPFPESDCEFASKCGLLGVWLPECPVLFRPFLADPRQITYSVGWRWNDQVLVKNVIPVSFGDTFAIYRFCNVYGGQLQIEVEGALWATFDPLHESSPLIDADYYVGFPITYALGNWQFRLRGYHISTHMGDEYLLNHPGFDRRNPSAEFLDFAFSHDFTDEIRYYGLVGVIMHQDKSFRMGRLFAAWGAELRLRQWGFTDFCNQLYGEPYYAMHFRWNKVFKNHLDQTYVIGYEIGKLCGLCRKLRFFLEYHDGYSLEGQFQKKATNYLSINFSYGY